MVASPVPVAGQRSFTFNSNDLNFILQQIEFQPLFSKDPVTGELSAITNLWDGTTAIYDSLGNALYAPGNTYSVASFTSLLQTALAGHGQLYTDAAGTPLLDWSTFNPTASTAKLYDAHGNVIWGGLPPADINNNVITLGAADAVAIFGQSYQGYLDIAGLRNVSGQFNNLIPGQQGWGADNSPFVRTTLDGYHNYVKQALAGAPSAEFTTTDLANVTGSSTSSSTLVAGQIVTFTYQDLFGAYTRQFQDKTSDIQSTLSKKLDGHHMVVNLNEFDTSSSTSTATYDYLTGAVRKDASGNALEFIYAKNPDGTLATDFFGNPILLKTVLATSTAATQTSSTTFLSGGELDPTYHPGLAATAATDPALIGGLFRNAANAIDLNDARNFDYTIHLPSPIAVTGAPVQIEMTAAPGGNGASMNSVIDYTPRMISQTITQSGTPVQYLKDANGHYHYNSGTGVVLLHDDQNHVVYNIGQTSAQLQSSGVQYDSSKTIDLSGVAYGAAIVDTTVPLLAGQADGSGGLTANGDLNLYSGAGYGTLSMTGQHDKQNTDANNVAGHGNHEYFYGNIASIAGNAPNNSWFVLFGQFFDHGLDFIDKNASNAAGTTYTITIPLAVDDPLYGVIGNDGKPTTAITINRATVYGSVTQPDGTQAPVYLNHDSPYIDQSQTYGSAADVTNLLREWVKDPNTGKLEMGSRLLDGHTVKSYTDAFGNQTTSTLPTLNELRAYVEFGSESAASIAAVESGVAGTTGRDALTWEDVTSGLRMRDASGHVIAGAGAGSVEPLLRDMNPQFDTAHISAATLTALNTAFGLTGASSLSFDTTGHLTGGIGSLAPFVNFANFSIQGTLYGAPALPDGSNVITAAPHAAIGEILLDSVGDHYIAGDGRANENAGLTAVHHVFHEENNYQVQNIENQVLSMDFNNGDPIHPHATAHDWQIAVKVNGADINVSNAITAVGGVGGYYIANDGDLLARDANGDYFVTTSPTDSRIASFVVDTNGHAVTADGSYTDSQGYISWDQNKMFNAAKMTVEMEYQHIAVDQYSRAVSPNIQEFAGVSTAKNAGIGLEFSQAAFRFGHSTLRETIDTMDPTGGITGKIMSYALEKAFLNPHLFAQIGPGAIALGMERQLMNEVDQYVTPSLNEGLLGQPLDLATINIARGRDVGMPTLNQAKTQLGQKAYADWADFGAQMVHPEALVSYIAAYSFDGDMTKAQTMIDLGGGAAWASLSASEQADALNRAGITGTTPTAAQIQAMALDAHNFINGADANKGVDKIDLWIGGLAEIHVAGGVLGETFDQIFVTQIEKLMDGDRFYYLQRLVNQDFGNEIQNEQFKDLVERTTGISHTNGNIFTYADHYYELNKNGKLATGALVSNVTTVDNNTNGDLYAGSKSDGSWHKVFDAAAAAAAGSTGGWLNATGGFTLATALAASINGVTTPLFDLWGQKVVDLYSTDMTHTAYTKVYDAATAAWLSKPADLNVTPLYTFDGTHYTFVGADSHFYGQIVSAHAGEGNGFDNATLDGALTNNGVTGIGIWSVNDVTTAFNGEIANHTFDLPTTDGIFDTPSAAMATANPNHTVISQNYIFDARPNGSSINKDGSLDTGANSAEVIVGTDYNDYIELGIGDDTGYGGKGNDIIFGGKSNAGHNTIYGGDGQDSLYGGDAPDLIDGGNGDDWIWGNSSGSSVNGVDQLIGGAGNDHIFGGIGIDKMFGGQGDDYLYGGQDTDPFMYGGDGNDYMNGGGGQDILFGGNGSDIMDGGVGQDNLYGGNGDDILRPGDFVDVAGNGGGGNVLIGGDNTTNPDGTSTDKGFDFADYSQTTNSTGLQGDLANQAVVGALAKDTTPNHLNTLKATNSNDVWVEMEGIIGTKNADRLRGDSAGDPDAGVSHGNNWLIGGSGNDLIEGRGGNDIIIGGSIRLDSLIGNYAGGTYVNGKYTGAYNNTLDPNGNFMVDANGNSHRANVTYGANPQGIQSNGLIDVINNQISPPPGFVGVHYDKHFTELLKSQAYKDYVLGDGGVDGTNTAAYRGSLANYTFNFLPVTAPNGDLINAVQIHDTRVGAATNDGTDLLVGIQQLLFNYNETTGAGTLVNIADAFDAGPAIAAGPLSLAFRQNVANAVVAANNGVSPAGTVIGTVNATNSLTAGQQAFGGILGQMTWNIANVAALPPGLFILTGDANTGASSTATLSFASAPNFEALKAAGGTVNAAGQLVYTVQVQVTDGIKTTTQSETVLINNVDQLGSGSVTTTGQTVAGNIATFTATNTLADPDLVTAANAAGTVGANAVYSLAIDGTNVAVGSGLAYTAGAAAQQIHVVATYAQPVPLPSVSVNSAQSAQVGTVGNDTLTDANGAGTLIGFAGNDTYVVGNAATNVIAGTGSNSVLTSLNSFSLLNNPNVSGNVTTLKYADALGNPLTGTFTGTGNNLGDAITGGTGANIITGGTGNDTVFSANKTAATAASNYNGGGGANVMDYSANTTGITATMGATPGSGVVTFTGGLALSSDILTNFQTVRGGSGNDTFKANPSGGVQTFIGGTSLAAAGSDWADFSAYAAALTLALNSNALSNVHTGGANGPVVDTLQFILNFVGGSNGNTVTVAATDTANHIFKGGAGADTFTFGSGNDTVIATVDNVRDTYNGGAGNDTADYSAYATNLTVTLNGGTAVTVGGSGTSNATSDRISNFENFIGGSGNDSITGDGNANALYGGAGDDILTGGGGLDSLYGGSGFDTAVFSGTAASNAVTMDANYNVTVSNAAGSALLNSIEALRFNGNNPTTFNLVADSATQHTLSDIVTGHAGPAILVGGFNNDTTFVINNAADIVIAGSGHVNTVQTSLATYTLGANVQNLTTISTANGGTVAGANVNHTWTGNALDNVIVAGTGNDILTGGAGNDTIDGGAGTNRANYSANTQAAGHAISLGTAIGSTTDVNALHVTVAGTGTAATSDGIDDLVNIQTLRFGTGSTAVNYNLVVGSTAGGNLHTGTVAGAATQSIIVGSSLAGGGQQLTGQAGNDIIVAGAGHDSLTGGAGTDTFVFKAGFGSDTITDFHHRYNAAGTVDQGFDATSHDVLDLSGLHTGLTSALQLFNTGHAAGAPNGNDTVLTFGSDQITLQHLTMSNFNTLTTGHNGDFIF